MARRAIAVTLSFILALLSLLSASTLLYKHNVTIQTGETEQRYIPQTVESFYDHANLTLPENITTTNETTVAPLITYETEYLNLNYEVTPIINTYWKMQCYNYCNGTVWTKNNTIPTIIINTTNLPYRFSPQNITPTYNRTIRIKSLNFTSTINSITLPLPWNITALLSFKLESSQPINYTLYLDTHGCLNLYVNTQSFTQVQITYNVSISSPLEQNIEKGSRKDIPPDIIQMYTQVPTLSPDFILFAESLRLENSTLWQQIQHVTRHFYLNFIITEENIPMNITDPVTWVIRNKKGPLNWVNTAYILTLRWLGIPARYVEGFKNGLHNLEANKTIINRNYTYCWTEVYIPKMGWGVIDLNARIFPDMIPTCLPLNYGIYMSILNITPQDTIRGLDNVTIVAVVYESLCGKINKKLLLNESLYGKVNLLSNVIVNLYIDHRYISSSLTNLTGFVEFNYFVESNTSVGTHEVLVNCSISALNPNDTDTFNVLPEYVIQIKVDKKYGLKDITHFNFDFNLFTPEPSKINYSEIVIKPLAYLTETGGNLTLPEVYLDENGFGTLTYVFNLNGTFIISANATLKDGKPLLTISDQIKITVYPTNLTVITYLNATTILRKYEVENVTIIAKVSAIGNSSIIIPLTTNITINLNETFLNLTASNGLKTLYIKFNISGLHDISISHVEFSSDVSNFIFIDTSSGQNYSNYIQILVVSEFNVQIEANPSHDVIRNETEVTFTIYTFNLSVPSPGNFTIIDETDNIIIADGLSNQSGIAVMEYVFPLNSTLGLHTIKVVFNDVTNTTCVWIYSETITIIYTNTDKIARGNNLTIIVNVTDVNGTPVVAPVNIYWNGTLLNSGYTNKSGLYTHYYLIPDTHPVGNITLWANTSSTGYLKDSTSNNLTIMILAPTRINFNDAGFTSINQGETPTIYGNITDNTYAPIGNASINVFINGQKYTTIYSNTDGSWNITIPDALLSPYKENLVTFQYNGTKYLLPSSNQYKIYVRGPTSITLTSPENNTSALQGETITIQGNITYPNGTTVIGTIVEGSYATLYWNGSFMTSVSVSANGTFQIPVSTSYLSLGKINITIRFEGNNFLMSNTTTIFITLYCGTSLTISINPTEAVNGTSIRIECWLKNNITNSGIQGKTIKIYKNGTEILNLITDSNGYANVLYTIYGNEDEIFVFNAKFVEEEYYIGSTSNNVTVRIISKACVVQKLENDRLQYNRSETVYVSGYVQYQNGTKIYEPYTIHWYVEKEDGTIYKSGNTTINPATGDFQYNFTLNPSLNPGELFLHANVSIPDTAVENSTILIYVCANIKLTIYIIPEDRQVRSGSDITVYGMVTDEFSNSIGEGNVTVEIEGKNVYETIVQSNGYYYKSCNIGTFTTYKNVTIYVSYIAPPGKEMMYNVTNPCNSSYILVYAQPVLRIINVNPTYIERNKSITISGTFLDESANVSIQNREIKIFANNTLLGSATTDENGDFTATLLLDPSLILGHYIIWAKETSQYLETTSIQNNSIIVFSKVNISISILDLYIKNGDKIEIQGHVSDDQNLSVTEGEIIIKINFTNLSWKNYSYQISVEPNGDFNSTYSIPNNIENSTKAIIIVKYLNSSPIYYPSEFIEYPKYVAIFAQPKIILPALVEFHINEERNITGWVEYLNEQGQPSNITYSFQVAVEDLQLQITKNTTISQDGTFTYSVLRNYATEFNISVNVPELEISCITHIVFWSYTNVQPIIPNNASLPGETLNVTVYVTNETNIHVYEGYITFEIKIFNISDSSQIFYEKVFNGTFGLNQIEIPDNITYTSNMTIKVKFTSSVVYLVDSQAEKYVTIYIQPTIKILGSSTFSQSVKASPSESYVIKVSRLENKTLRLFVYDERSSLSVYNVKIGLLWNGTWYNKTIPESGVVEFTIPPEKWTKIGIYNVVIRVFDLKLIQSFQVRVTVRLIPTYEVSETYVTIGDNVTISGEITSDLNEKIGNISVILSLKTEEGIPLVSKTMMVDQNGRFIAQLNLVNLTFITPTLVISIEYAPSINTNKTIWFNGTHIYLDERNSTLFYLKMSKTIFFYQSVIFFFEIAPHVTNGPIQIFAKLIDNYGRPIPNSTVEIYLNNTKITEIETDGQGKICEEITLNNTLILKETATYELKISFKNFQSHAILVKVVKSPTIGTIDTSNLDFSVYLKKEQKTLPQFITIGIASTILVVSEPYISKLIVKRKKAKKVRDATYKLLKLLDYLEPEKDKDEAIEIIEEILKTRGEEALEELELPEIFKKILESLDRKQYRASIFICVSEFLEKMEENYKITRLATETVREFGTKIISNLTPNRTERKGFNVLINAYSKLAYGKGPFTKQEALESARAVCYIYHILYEEELPEIVSRLLGLGKIREIEEGIFGA